ncbi:hypothetical protein APHAL10511_006766 [Amanita phalloides]|nr:hypothetical protein APHAL10511_006766 [Amanita phalloides]
MAQLDADNDDASRKSLADAAASDHRSLKSNGSVHDPDAQQMVITSLRTQIQDLVGQVGQLNNKLVKSYNHVSDLEDELHVSSSHLRNSSIKISQLELERSQHLSALSTGLLVEKSHVTTELTRLMEKATEEAAHRGQAESARVAIEKELDDLSANLFNQANTMVAEARYARHVSERKMGEAESALKGAEEAVGVMQRQLQVLREEKELAEKKAQEMQVSAGKVQWIERHNGVSIARSLRLLSSHSPYQDFLLFVAHLRTVHTSTPHLPSMSTLLNLPFFQRLLIEDSEPTVRLDLAPALNWLSRRSVLAAIHNSQLVIEPCSVGSLLNECHASSMGGSSNDISCALCGIPVLSKDDVTRSLPTYPLTTTRSNGTNNLWSATLFRKSYSNPYSGSNPPTPHSSPPVDLPQIFVFRIASNPPTIAMPSPIPTSTPPPLLSHSSSNSQSCAAYPLCRSGWCLGRLRTTCSLWSFVRVGLVEKIWEEEVPVLPPPPPKMPVQADTSKPPLPPRKRGLWGMASVLGERAATWSEAAKKIAPTSQPEQQALQEVARKSPTEKQTALPPVAAAASAPTTASPVPSSHATNHLRPPEQASASSPPSIPKRSGGRAPPRKTTSPVPNNSAVSAPTKQLPDGAVTLSPNEMEKEGTASPQQKPEALAIPSVPSPTPAIPSNAPPILLRAYGHKRHSSTLPERIPLPDSRPGTPLNGGPPSRTTSPAPGPGAPPPIPRRAAARGTRLVSSGDAGSRPGTPPIHTSATGATVVPTSTVSVPAPIPEAETKPDAREKVEAGSSIESTGAGVAVVVTTVTTAQVRRENAPEVAKLFEAPRIAVSTSETSSASPTTEDWKSVAVTPIGTGSPLEEATPWFENKFPQPTVAATDGQTQPKSQAVPPVEASAFNVESQDVRSNSNGSVIVSSGGEEEELISSDKSIFGSSKAASPFQSESSVGLGAAVMEVLSSSVQSAEEKGGEYKEVYVGDATWEERTWKELVRLREDMFWARIGGLR